MDEKLQKLAEKIYSEGVQKAKSEAESIISEAKKKAEEIVKQAEREKEEILKKANQEKEELYKKSLVEFKSAADQVKLSLKQELANFIAKNALQGDISLSISDVDFIKDILLEIVKKWDFTSYPELEVILPENKKKDFEKLFSKKVKSLFEKNVVISFDKIPNGFKIQPKNGNFVLSFTDDDLNQFFSSFLKQKTKELLFSLENK
ncbi:MAG: V-type ATP synthase subunit E [Brevinematia bacterium]